MILKIEIEVEIEVEIEIEIKLMIYSLRNILYGKELLCGFQFKNFHHTYPRAF